MNINPKYKNFNKEVKIRLEMDEMWGRVSSKKTPCWLWHAINHDTGEVVAFVLGSREECNFKILKKLLKPLKISKFYTDGNWSYIDSLPKTKLVVSKKNTQKIERKHLTFRTRLKRLARKTICYSKSLEMHKIMVSLMINVLEFDLQPF